MFKNRLKIFRLLGFDVYLDATWLFLAALVIWTLGAHAFPEVAPGLPAVTYWAMAVAGTLGLFASLTLHELAHSIVARHYQIPIDSITLFVFGGVAAIRAEPERPRDEFLMAAAGPALSIVLAVLFLGLSLLNLGAPVSTLMLYLCALNGVLAAFNLIPAFPLDGGRMLRAALWGWRKDLQWATHIASGFGNLFGVVLIISGIYELVTGHILSGVWRILIGLFVRSAAEGAKQEIVVNKSRHVLHKAQPDSF